MQKIIYLKTLGFVLLGILLVTDSFALEWFPEFGTLTETEQAEFEGPIRLNPEYQSDILTYTKPLEWEYGWLLNPYGLDMSVGSTSAQHFMMDNRLKIHTSLNKYLEFRFTFFDEKNREREDVHHIVELVVWPKEWVGISFYGEPSLYKRDDDTGIALLFKPTRTHELRIFNTFVDVTRLKRNDKNDTYILPNEPIARGLVGRIWSHEKSENGDGDFLEYAVRVEAKTRWLFPDEKYEYQYWKNFGSLFFSYGVNQKFRLTTRIQWDRKFESKSATEAGSIIANTQNESNWKRDRLFTTLRAKFPGVGPWGRWSVIAGFQYAYRKWDTEGITLTYKDILPHVWLGLPAFGEGKSTDEVQIGYECTFHKFTGPRMDGGRVLIHPDDETPSSVEHRLNLVYEFVFSEKANIRLVATADLDKFATAKTWEGGNAQFRLFF